MFIWSAIVQILAFQILSMILNVNIHSVSCIVMFVAYKGIFITRGLLCFQENLSCHAIVPYDVMQGMM